MSNDGTVIKVENHAGILYNFSYYNIVIHGNTVTSIM